MATNLKELSKLVPIIDYDHAPNPAWKSDSGRNSNSGKWSGTFAGYFSQIDLGFGNCNQEQMTIIKNVFEKATCEITYPDSKDGLPATEVFYGSVIKAKLNKWNGLYKPFSITLTALNPYEERIK